jgi:hypothetical protein
MSTDEDSSLDYCPSSRRWRDHAERLDVLEIHLRGLPRFKVWTNLRLINWRSGP